MYNSQFHVLFSSISVISRQCADDNERISALPRCQCYQLYIKVFKDFLMKNKALSGKLSCLVTGLVY